MKRRQFFSNLPLSVAGLSLASSCSNIPENDKTGKIDEKESQFSKEVPSYRDKIKTTFQKMMGKTPVTVSYWPSSERVAGDNTHP